jgi:antagonist of KipI
MPSIIIQSAGLLTTVQDSGRYGYQRFGMPVSGAMDVFSLQLANLLVGNQPGAACLETTFTGPEIFFTSEGAIAISGADMNPCKNGRPIPQNTTIEVKKGDILDFGGLLNGCRSYIAFAGGINVPKVMGSSSTYLRAKTGGFEGRALKTGDELSLGELPGKLRIMEIPKVIMPLYHSFQTIRIIPGPEVNRFDLEGIRHFLTSEYNITDQSDRMGYRLSGQAIVQLPGNADIISAGISFGTIQIPGNGQPIILMADRQTTGGYTRIANAVSVDLTLLAQLKPGDSIRFSEISLEKAQDIYIDRQKAIEGHFS